jgi:hypothetical protein
MTSEFLHGGDIHSGIKEIRTEGAAKIVGGEGLYPCHLTPTLHNFEYGIRCNLPPLQRPTAADGQ